MNVDDVCRLIGIAARSGVASLEVTVGDARVRIEMRPDRGGSPAADPAAAIGRPSSRRAASEPTASEPTASAPGSDAVRATTDGIVHLQAAPGAPPFVRQGEPVAPGATVCLIEVMKTFVPVTAVRGGIVRAIRVAQGQVVAFDDVLVDLA